MENLNNFFFVYKFSLGSPAVLAIEKAFDSEGEAEEWIATNGEKSRWYLIQKAYRRK